MTLQDDTEEDGPALLAGFRGAPLRRAGEGTRPHVARGAERKRPPAGGLLSHAKALRRDPGSRLGRCRRRGGCGCFVQNAVVNGE